MNISGVEIGGESPCRTVAEVSNNHNGRFENAVHLIDDAKAAGADFVKFQAYTPDELVRLRGDGPAPAQWGEQGWSMRDLYEKARTPLEWFPDLADHCRSVGIPWFASVFGPESMRVVLNLGCPALKVAALDRRAPGWLNRVRQAGLPVLVSTPDLNPPPMYAAEWLYCPPGYPTKPEDVRLPRFSDPGLLGLSSHCLDPLLPVAAVARGAKLIEMHMMLDDEPSELEADISLTTTQFAEMVERIRRTEVFV